LDGSIDRLKSRLVVKGYTQLYGLDFNDTFSPVVRASTVRIVLSIAVSRGWNMRQLDVKNAFLYGLLQEHVYTEQPPSYADSSHPNHVCHLKKAIYGLKQAPRAWFHWFSHFLLTVGFNSSQADCSLFVYSSSHEIIYLLLYVDDIIITGSNMPLIDTFIHKLRHEFSMKDLGTLNYFLGLEVTHSATGIFLSQLKYTRDLLLRVDLLDSKPVGTPMIVSQHLTTNGNLFHSPTTYRFLVGALQYLTITRPNITHAVNSVSQSCMPQANTISRLLKGSSNMLKKLFTLVSKSLHPPPSTSQLSQMPTGLAVQIQVDQHLGMPSSWVII
jgi:hypothetical protein